VHVGVITLFPDLVRAVLGCGVVGRAASRGLLELATFDPRDHTSDLHRTVDDRPYGGGPGMVMKFEPLRDAIREARARAPQGSPVVYLGPQGRRLEQARAAELAALPGLVLVAGRYEGVDERLLATEVDDEVSIGDYVLSGGELAAMVVVDVIARLLPGALGDERSAQQDSFATGLLDHPHYTRPEEIEGLRVPEALLGGHHAQIERWRLKQALGRTWSRRPELLARRPMNGLEHALLAEYVAEATTNQVL
jgi:tRNA (guanine37-N1)-methyltransferase